MKITKEKLKGIEEFVEKNSTEREWIHTRQIRPIAAELAEKESADKEVVDIAVLFHDIGKGKISADKHEFESERIAKDFLEKQDLHGVFIQKVCNAVRRHALPWKNEMPKTTEDKVVFDADMIQQLSPFGIAKQFDDFKGLNFIERMKKSRDILKKAHDLVITKSGKEMVEKRIKYVEDFFESVLK